MARIDYNEILRILLREQPLTQADLARRTGLSKATISGVMAEFREMGILDEESAVVSSRGRRSTGISVDLRSICVATCRIDLDRASFALVDGNGEVGQIAVRRYPRQIPANTLVNLLAEGLQTLVEQADGRLVVGIGVSSLGWILRDGDALTIYADGFPELSRIDIQQSLRDRFPSLLVQLEHDAKTLALAESEAYRTQYGAVPHCLVSLLGGAGIGGGIVIDGNIYRGSLGIAGEFGHQGINFNSSIVRKDVGVRKFAGLYEDYASPRAMSDLLAMRLIEFPNSSLSEDSQPDEIAAAAVQGDELAEWVLSQAARYAAYGMAGILFALDPDVVVIDWDLEDAEPFVRRVHGHLAEYIPAVILDRLSLLAPLTAGDGVYVGAKAMVLQAALETDQLFPKLSEKTAS